MAGKTKESKNIASDTKRKSSTTKKKDKLRLEEPEPEEQKKQGTKTSSGRKMAMDQLGKFKDFAETTSNVVQRAASILEEEIAAGIVAAKKVEKRFVNVSELRSGKPDEVIQRFRRDSHELVDILLDMINVSLKYIGNLTQQVIRIRGAETQEKPESMAPGQIPTLMMPNSIKAGESAEVPMTLENDSDKSTDELKFLSTDLVNATGDRISSEQTTFTPPSLTLGPNKAEKVTVTVHVPEGTPPGVYSGLVQATKLNQLRALLMVQVS